MAWGRRVTMPSCFELSYFKKTDAILANSVRYAERHNLHFSASSFTVTESVNVEKCKYSQEVRMVGATGIEPVTPAV